MQGVRQETIPDQGQMACLLEETYSLFVCISRDSCQPSIQFAPVLEWSPHRVLATRSMNWDRSLLRWRTTWSAGSGVRCCRESRALWCCAGVTDACLASEFYMCIQTKTKWKKDWVNRLLCKC